MDTRAVAEAVAATQEKSADQKHLLHEELRNALSELRKITKAGITIDAKRLEEEKGEMPLYYEIWEILSDRVASGLTTLATQYKLDKNTFGSVVGHEKVDNIGSGNDRTNPVLFGANKAYAEYFKVYLDMFCIPEGSNALNLCRDIRNNAKNKRYENFIDFFTSDKTWGEPAVLDAMTLAREFFGSVTSDLDDTAQLKENPSFYMAKQGAIARNNLRMGVINQLASQRAPTSYGTEAVLSLLFNSLGNTGQVSSSNYKEACKQNIADMVKDAPLNAYVCSYTNLAADGQDRVISQAAIDRIMQRDLMMSPFFMQQVQSPDFNAQGPINKMNAYLATVKVAQLYDQLQAIKMQSAVSATNLIHGN
jgi:hypothetical protein